MIKINYSIYILVILILTSSCNDQENVLPKSEYFKPIPKQGINRNIYLEIRNGKLYSRNIEIREIVDIRHNPEKYINLNEGSNYFTLILNISENCTGYYLDSLFHQFAKHHFYKLFLLTNNKKDSVGIKVMLAPIDILKPPTHPNNLDSFIRYIDIKGSYFHLENSAYSIKELKSKILDILKNGKVMEVIPADYNDYKDLIFLLDNYNLVYQEFRDSISKDIFGKTYEILDENEKYDIKKLTIKRFAIKLKE